MKGIYLKRITFPNFFVEYCSNKCGLVVSYGNIEEIREKIIQSKNKYYLRQELGHNGKKAFYMKYSWKILESRLVNIYSQLHMINYRSLLYFQV